MAPELSPYRRKSTIKRMPRLLSPSRSRGKYPYDEYVSGKLGKESTTKKRKSHFPDYRLLDRRSSLNEIGAGKLQLSQPELRTKRSVSTNLKKFLKHGAEHVPGSVGDPEFFRSGILSPDPINTLSSPLARAGNLSTTNFYKQKNSGMKKMIVQEVSPTLSASPRPDFFPKSSIWDIVSSDGENALPRQPGVSCLQSFNTANPEGSDDIASSVSSPTPKLSRPQFASPSPTGSTTMPNVPFLSRSRSRNRLFPTTIPETPPRAAACTRLSRFPQVGDLTELEANDLVRGLSLKSLARLMCATTAELCSVLNL